jgi:hypothetical protein
MNLLASGGIAHSVRSRAAVEIDSDSDQTLTVSHDFGVNVLVSSKVNNEGAVSAIGMRHSGVCELLSCKGNDRLSFTCTDVDAYGGGH